MNDQIEPEKAERATKRGIYLLPNLLTTLGLFSGFYAIVAAMRGDFDLAAIAVYIAMIMDGLDGRVARLTNTQSAFGVEYDSLADIVSFGIAPSLVAYQWGLVEIGKPGWLVAFFYAAATALRLARFNVKVVDSKPSKYFQGLPCPAAAGLVAGMIWVAHEYGVPGKTLWDLAAIVTLITASLMVSTVKYYSFKDIDLKGKVPFVVILAAVILLLFISIDPPKVLMSSFALYVISGPAYCAWRWLKSRKAKRSRMKKTDL